MAKMEPLIYRFIRLDENVAEPFRKMMNKLIVDYRCSWHD